MAFENTGSEPANNAPIGAEPSNSTPVGGETPAPKPIELSDDTLVLDRTSGKPVKYSEYNRTFQSQFTRASQEGARLREELTRERAQREAYEKQLAQSRQPSQPNQNPQGELFERLKSLPYLNGEQAAEMVQSISGEIAKRDQILTVLAKELVQARNTLNGLYTNHTNSTWESQMTNWVSDLGYDPKTPGVMDIAKEIYLAYEGADLNQEFPRILKERMGQLEQVFEARRNANLQAARRGPFLPGRGGNANPSKPLEMDPKASPRQIADQLWNTWGSERT